MEQKVVEVSNNKVRAAIEKLKDTDPDFKTRFELYSEKQREGFITLVAAIDHHFENFNDFKRALTAFEKQKSPTYLLAE